MCKELAEAIEAGNVELSEKLIEQINRNELHTYTQEDRSTLLHIAAKKGLPTVCKALISKIGSEDGFVKERDHYNQTALHLAAKEGHKEVCKIFLEAYPDTINAVAKKGKTVPHYAALGGNVAVCEFLIYNLPTETINVVTIRNENLLHFAALGGNVAVCEFLIPKMPTEAINAVTSSKANVLHFAAFGGNVAICDFLIQKMSAEAINAVDVYGSNLLHYAAEGGSKEAFQFLSSKMPADTINYVNKSGEAALHHAAKEGHKEIVWWLLYKLPPPYNLPSSDGETPSFLAYDREHFLVGRVIELGISAFIAFLFLKEIGLPTDCFHEISKFLLEPKLLQALDSIEKESSKVEDSISFTYPPSIEQDQYDYQPVQISGNSGHKPTDHM